MSGGHFNHNDCCAGNIADEIQGFIDFNESTDLDGFGDLEGRNYPPEVITLFEEAVRIGKLASAMHHCVDLLLSGDKGPESFVEDWNRSVDTLPGSSAVAALSDCAKMKKLLNTVVEENSKLKQLLDRKDADLRRAVDPHGECE